MLQYNPTVSGSLSVTGTITATQGITGSFSGSVAGFPTDVSAFSASLSTRITSTELTSSEYVTTSGSLASRVTLTEATASQFVTASGSLAGRITSNEARTGSFATTGSNQFNGSQIVTGSLTATGTIVAQTLVVQTITSSVDFVTGSTRYGSTTGNTHEFTGSLLVSGSQIVNGNVGIGTTNPYTRLDVAGSVSINGRPVIDNSSAELYIGGITGVSGRGTDVVALYTANSEKMRIASGGNVGIGTTSPAEKLVVTGAIMSTGGITGHGANRTTLSQEGGSGAYWQSYGTNTSTVGTFVLRQASSDFSIQRAVLSIDTSGAATFSSSSIATNYIASSGNNTTVFNSTAATTGWVQMALNNTGGSLICGIESSVAGTVATNSTAYATVLRNYTNTDFQIATNNTVRLTILNTGAATFASSVTTTQLLINESSPKIILTPLSYSGNYRTVLGTRSGAEGVLQLGNNNPNYIVGGNTGTGGSLYFYVNAISDFITSTNGTLALVLASTGAATFSNFVRVEGSYLQVANATNPSVYINNTTVQWRTYLPSGTNNFAISDAVRDVLTLGYNGANSYFNGCNVGIGTTTPNHLLTISASASNKTEIGFYNTFNDAGNRNWAIATNQVAFGDFHLMQSNAKDGNPTSSGTSRLMINASGNVGIGTTAPTLILDVEGQAATFTGTAFRTAKFSAKSSAVADKPGIVLGYDSSGGGIIAAATESAGQPINFWTYNGSAWGERMRITSGGHTKISSDGTYLAAGSYHEVRSANTTWTQVISNKSATPYGLLISYSAASPNVTGDNQFIWCEDSTQSKFIVWSSGNVVNRNNSYGAISDIKFKENISDATSKLADLLKVKVRNYNLIGDSNKQLGVIAQELEEVFPNMVEVYKEKDSDETSKSVKYSVFVPMLIKAVQELKAEIDILKNK
jgi:hypothetical protein